MDSFLIFALSQSFSPLLYHIAQNFAEVDNDVNFVLWSGIILDFLELVSSHTQSFLIHQGFWDI